MPCGGRSGVAVCRKDRVGRPALAPQRAPRQGGGGASPPQEGPRQGSVLPPPVPSSERQTPSQQRAHHSRLPGISGRACKRREAGAGQGSCPSLRSGPSPPLPPPQPGVRTAPDPPSLSPSVLQIPLEHHKSGKNFLQHPPTASRPVPSGRGVSRCNLREGAGQRPEQVRPRGWAPRSGCPQRGLTSSEGWRGMEMCNIPGASLASDFPSASL